MRRLLKTAAAAMLLVAVAAGPARAITFGTADGGRHPNVGALLADYDPDSPGPDLLCTGTLVAQRVFLTAAHCTAFLEGQGITRVWVTFAPAYDDDSTSTAGLFGGGYALQEASNLEKSWLLLSMQPATGDGGTCFGDSGGPHFLGASGDVVASITITGDAMCRATDKTYRTDTPAARAFLDDFVALP